MQMLFFSQYPPILEITSEVEVIRHAILTSKVMVSY